MKQYISTSNDTFHTCVSQITNLPAKPIYQIKSSHVNHIIRLMDLSQKKMVDVQALLLV